MLILSLLPGVPRSEPLDLTRAPGSIRVAVWNIGFFRAGAGLLLRDIARRTPPVRAAVQVLQEVQPDILLLTVFDRDPEGRALAAFAALLAGPGAPLDLPHAYQGVSNTGRPSGRDLDQDGRLAEPEDAWGYGAHPGQYAMAFLSRFPIEAAGLRTYRMFRWAEMPGARRPISISGGAFHPDPVWRALRLSSKSHWDIPVRLPGGQRLRFLAAHPTPPAFDGPGNRNTDRNADELRLLGAMIGGAAWLRDDAGQPSGGEGPVVLLGTLNADPDRGAADRAAISALLTDARLQDPKPVSPGDPAGATVAWPRDDKPDQRQRVDYVLPDARLQVTGTGVYWPDGVPSRHLPANRLVWADLVIE